MRDIYAEIISAAHSGSFGMNSLPHPTAEQLRAGNYRKGRVTIHGMPIAIETPQGQRRMGKSDGQPWSVICMAHYGYIVGTKASDGDAIDVYVGPVPESTKVWVVNQNDKAGNFDEVKVLLGFHDEQSARAAYMNSYERGWKGLGSLIACSVDQFRWWLKFGDTTKPLTERALPHDGTQEMTETVWDSAANPVGCDVADLIYRLRGEDSEGLMLDAVTLNDILESSDGEMTLDALVVQYNQVERKAEQLRRIMESVGGEVKPLSVQITPPFKQRGTTNVVILFELSDGQTVSVWMHNPDSTPNRIKPDDELVSWAWRLNKKDVSIIVAPEKGQDLNPREVSRRIMRLAEKNSARFAKANAGRAERMANIESMKSSVAEKEATLAALDTEHEELTVKVTAKRNRVPATLQGTTQGADTEIEMNQQTAATLPPSTVRNQAVKAALAELGWNTAPSSTQVMVTIDGSVYSLTSSLNEVRGKLVSIDWNDSGWKFSDTLTLEPADFAAELDKAFRASITAARQAVVGGDLPAGWTEQSPGGMATNKDPENGGIVDKVIGVNEWFVVFNREGMETIDGLASRADAFRAFAAAIEKADSRPVAGADFTIQQVASAMARWDKESVPYSIPEINNAVNFAVDQGWVSRRSTTQVGWTQAGIDMLNADNLRGLGELARELVPVEFKSVDSDGEGFNFVAADGLGIRLKSGPRGQVLGYVIDARGYDSLGARGNDPAQIKDLVDTALGVIEEKRGEQRILEIIGKDAVMIGKTRFESGTGGYYSTGRNSKPLTAAMLAEDGGSFELDDYALLRQAGSVTITSVGSENVYFTKGGVPYFTKVLNTDDYQAGQVVDLSGVQEPSYEPALKGATLFGVAAILKSNGWVDRGSMTWDRGSWHVAGNKGNVVVSEYVDGELVERGTIAISANDGAMVKAIEDIVNGAREDARLKGKDQVLDLFKSGQLAELNNVEPGAYMDAMREFLEGDLSGVKLAKRDMFEIPANANINPQAIDKGVTEIKRSAESLFKVLATHAGDKDVRSYLNGVHYEPENGIAAASDGYRMMIVKGLPQSDMPAKPESAPQGATVLGTDGQWIEGRFPDWRRVTNRGRGEKLIFNAKEAAAKVRGAVRVGEVMRTRYGVAVPFIIDGKGSYVSARYVLQAITAMQKLGYKKFSIQPNGNGTGVFIASPDNRVNIVIMGIKAEEGQLTPITAGLDASPRAAEGFTEGEMSEPAQTPESFRHEGFNIYPFNGRWAVQTAENLQREQAGERQIGGDTIVDTQEQAKAQAELQVAQEADKAARAEQDAAQQAAEAAANANLQDTDGFAEQFSGVQRERVRATLAKTYRTPKGVMSLRDYVRAMVAEGRVISDWDGERVLEDKRTEQAAGVKAITKTGLDYAEYLIAKNGPATPAKTDFVAWEEAFYSAIEEQGDMSRSDAQGVAEAQGAMMDQQFVAGVSPEDAARAVLAAGSVGGDDQAGEAKAFLNDVIAGNVDYMDEALADRLEAVAGQFEGDAEVQALFEQAANAYSAYMIEQARAAMA